MVCVAPNTFVDKDIRIAIYTSVVMFNRTVCGEVSGEDRDAYRHKRGNGYTNKRV